MTEINNTNIVKHTSNNQLQFNPLEQINIANIVFQELENSQILDKFKDPKTNIIDKGRVIATLVKGAKLGLDPFTSITVSKDLENTSVFAIDLGLSLGLTPLESIKKIYTISTGNNGISLHTSVHVISKKLIEAGVVINLIDDYVPVYSYLVKTPTGKDFLPIESDRVEVDGRINYDKFFLIDNSVTQTEVDDAKSSGKVFLRRYVSDYVTTIEMTRSSTNTKLKMSYYRSDALKAGFLEVKNDKGQVINEGKYNWNSNEKGMMRNRLISNMGRIIAADKLNGVYDVESETEHSAIEVISQID